MAGKNYVRNPQRRVTLDTGSESHVKQSDAAGVDINLLMDQYTKTGDPLIFMRKTGGVYADVSNAPDYATCLNIVREANLAFDALDAKIRDRFANDPAKLIAALGDASRRDELVELGLLEVTKTPQSSTPPASAATTPEPAGGTTPAATSQGGKTQ